MLELPTLIEPLFRAAGWDGPPENARETHTASAHDIANRILQEFGGLRVGACGPGTEMAASDVHFYRQIRRDQELLVRPWARQIGEVAAFASAHHDHMVLFVGADGSFYVFTDPDEQLYLGPQNFGDFMRRVLWGYAYGPTMPKDGKN